MEENANFSSNHSKNPTADASSVLQLKLEKIAALSSELRSQQEKLDLSSEIEKLFQRFSEDKQFNNILSPTIIYDLKGRPKNTTREKTALEREEEKIKNFQKNEKKKENEAKKDENSQKDNIKKEQNSQNNIKKEEISQNNIKKEEISQKLQQTNIPPLPKGISRTQISGYYNPRPDGNCGYRALAYALFKNEEKYVFVKTAMLLFLNKNQEFYKSHFGNSPDAKDPLPGSFQSIMAKLQSKASASDSSNWFQFPEMVQLAADTFKRPIASYNPYNTNVTFVPFFSLPETTRPIALHLYNSHFYIIAIKEKSRPHWPPPPSYHKSTCTRFNFSDFSSLYNS